MARTYARFVLSLSIGALVGCSSTPGPEADAGAAIDAPSGDGSGGGGHDSGTNRDGSVDTGQALRDTGSVDDAGADAGATDVDAGTDASAPDDAGTDAALASDAGSDAGTDAATVGNDAGTSMPHCTGAQEMCPCATGWYCAPRGSFCLNPAAPCP